MEHKNLVYLGMKAYVVCINVLTGEEVWRSKVKRSQIISVIVEEKIVIAHSGGHLFGLDRNSGQLLWKNTLPGLGYGYCFLATENSDSSSQINNTVASIEQSRSDGPGGSGH